LEFRREFSSLLPAGCNAALSLRNMAEPRGIPLALQAMLQVPRCRRREEARSGKKEIETKWE
jgi:hypothetical protein